MNIYGIALIGLMLAGSPGAPAPAEASKIWVLDTFEELKAEVAEASKAKALSEEQAVDFSTRAMDFAVDSKDAAGRIDALKLSLGLRFRGENAELARLRGELWDLVIDKDADEGALLAPAVGQYLTDTERAAKLGKRSKAPEVKAACAYVPLNALINRDDRSEKESKALLVSLKAFQKEFGQVIDPRRKKPWAEACETVIFQVEHLSIGALAPEIEANDTAGVKFKLSDYRGKVVLLDFWGNW